MPAAGYAYADNEDSQRDMSDVEIIISTICAAMYFNSNQNKACGYLKDHNLIPDMLEKSRFNRPLLSKR
ncbi:hypothetical protein [uncultured Nostoc sp.]|uniref:hypothetical protein n=1 Tax=uncultured Nostoc sp. TaxID=340711 RepID=UPI0035CB8311